LLVLAVHVTWWLDVVFSSPCPPIPWKTTGRTFGDVGTAVGSDAEAIPAPITAMTERAARTANPNDLKYCMLLPPGSWWARPEVNKFQVCPFICGDASSAPGGSFNSSPADCKNVFATFSGRAGPGVRFMQAAERSRFAAEFAFL
jgi:hypothetical protein